MDRFPLLPPPRARRPHRLKPGGRIAPLAGLALLFASVMILSACGSSRAYHADEAFEAAEHMPESYGDFGTDDSMLFDTHEVSGAFARPESVSLTVSAQSRGGRSDRGSAAAPPPPAQRASAPSRSQPALTAEAPEPDTATDARRGPLLIYTGQIILAAFRVTDTLERAVAHVEALGGYAQQRTSTQVILRVPAEHFMDVLESFRELGEVQDVSWTAQDVGEEYRDLRIRLANARALRERLEALLDQAESVEDILAIETQLERITLEIERILGRVRHLEDQVAYSTLTVRVGQRSTGGQPRAQRLPFPFLYQLGLPGLLNQ